MEHERSFEPEPEMAAAARRFARAVLTQEDVSGEVLENTELLANELAANAILHARTMFTLTLEVGLSQVRVAVLDHSGCMPQEQPHSDEATSGRGLQVLDVLTSQWGAEVHGDGTKTVWCEISAEAA